MTPEAAAYLDKARQHLDKAQFMLARYPDEAGRAAYLAGMHAAQAFIFEHTGRSSKSHRGVQTEFSRLSRTSPAFDEEARAFLSRAYSLKDIADYMVGSNTRVTPDLARQTMGMAERFVTAIADLLAGDAL